MRCTIRFADALTAGIIDSDPLFKNRTINRSVSYWHLNYGSPCIDSGDPLSDHSLEPDYPAGRVNMGFYGNTPEATPGCALSWQGSLMVAENAYVTDVPLVDLHHQVSSTSGCDSSLGLLSRYSNDGTNWSLWLVYNDDRLDWDLGYTDYGGSSKLGMKTVYTQFMDRFGNLSPVYSDDIILRPDPVIYVDAGRTDGDGSGTSWENSIRNLQIALLYSRPDDEIWLAAGLYKPYQCGGKIPCDRGVSFVLQNDVSLYGGFAGTESNRDQRDCKTHITVLSGDLYGDDGADFSNTSENSHHVVVGSNTDFTAVLDGFTVRAGNADYARLAYPRNGGAGMYNENGSPAISNCIFENNLAPLRGGGGMLNHGESSPDIHNCIFPNNVGMNGGGVYNAYNSSPMITNTIFYQNHAGIGDQGGIGGAVELVYFSNTSLINCTLSDNTAATRGGGIRGLDSTPRIMNSILWGNTAPTGPQIALEDSLIQINYSDIQGGMAAVSNANAANTNYNDNIDADPDYIDSERHLGTSSPCIDRGNLFSEYLAEPDFPEGRINMGAYGNTSEAAVAIDSDDDGVPDGLDGCPENSYKSEPGVCGCDEPDMDIDGDLLLDCQDLCPMDSENDADSDGVCGDEDLCPETIPSSVVDAFGCTDEQRDDDIDGYSELDGDCNDNDAEIYPGHVETCDGKDNDCSPSTADGSGETAPLNVIQEGVCLDSFQVCQNGEWIDNYTAVIGYEGTESSCDQLDNNCNGIIDENCLRASDFTQDRDVDGIDLSIFANYLHTGDERANIFDIPGISEGIIDNYDIEHFAEEFGSLDE